MPSPYDDLPPQAFWRTGAAALHPLDISDLWSPKWPIDRHSRIATAGSCFARNFGQALLKRGFAWMNEEPAPAYLSPDLRARYGYDIFSARTGNIYTARQWLQWVQWSCGYAAMPDEIWVREGRYYDPFRPTIEPDGFETREELLASRKTALASFARAIGQADIFLFTIGLTEGWRHRQHGHEYPSAPGVTAGEFDPALHILHNQTMRDVLSDLRAAMEIASAVNRGVKFLLTVSPVPLTATASGQHVLVANSRTKSTLRTAVGELSASLPHCDYFPSYEIVTGAPYRSMFFAPNLRNVVQMGVDFIMDSFFRALDIDAADIPNGSDIPAISALETADPLCDDALLDRFAKP